MTDISGDFYYKRETIPANLAKLRTDLLEAFNISPDAVGIRGNPLTHFRGYHRSRNFILNSPHCTDTGYSVTAEVNKGGDPEWVSALDLALDTKRLMEVCSRLDAAVKAGKIEKVVEWFGNLNGDTRVDGYDNIANRVATSDSSHLWHLHISLARANADDDHSDLFRILTGASAPVLPVSPTQAVRIYQPDIERAVATLVPAGVTDWMSALHHWYRTPGEPGSVRELEHLWRFRLANFSDAGRWESLTPGKTVLTVPRTLGY
jgi:hypothetical protein